MKIRFLNELTLLNEKMIFEWNSWYHWKQNYWISNETAEWKRKSKLKKNQKAEWINN